MLENKEKYWRGTRNFCVQEGTVINLFENFVFDVQQKNILNVGN